VGRKLKTDSTSPEDVQKRELKQEEKQTAIAAVVVVACNRPDYLEKTIQGILK
jgi:hypothetical protein